jgi:hypothetical protein
MLDLLVLKPAVRVIDFFAFPIFGVSGQDRAVCRFRQLHMLLHRKSARFGTAIGAELSVTDDIALRLPLTAQVLAR